MAAPRTLHAAVGLGTLAVAVAMAFGAWGLKSDAGYAGVGPNFLPWLVSVALALCGLGLLREAYSGGFRMMSEPSGAEHGFWPGFAWVSAGILLNATLITHIGFILSCALCFALAVRGLKGAEGSASDTPGVWIKDTLVGVAIAAPVYWMFTKGLGISLPGLTNTGWL